MLKKLNSCSSYNKIGLQNKSWVCMATSSKPMSNHMCKGIPVHAAIDNNDGVQQTLTGKGTTHDTNMTLFQSVCESLSWSLFENVTIFSAFNVIEMCVKRTVCSIATFFILSSSSIRCNIYSKDTGD